MPSVSHLNRLRFVLPMMRALSITLWLCALAVAVAGQAPGAPPSIPSTASAPNTGSLGGTIVDEPGSHPVKKVLVQIVAEDQKQSANYSATTDADGHFHVENVIPGRYHVFFEKTGLAEVNSRGHRADVNVMTIVAGKPLEDLVFHMLPTAVITGRVTDEDGDPMSSVRVIVQRRVPGKSKRGMAGMAATNDLGEYRVAGLFPGQYWAVAVPPPDFRDYSRPSTQTATVPTSDAPPETRYVTTYYPGTTDSAQASPIALRAGDETPVNVMLVPTRTYRIRGVVTGIVAGETHSVELSTKTGEGVQGAEVGSDGAFEIHGASPGSYVLKAYSTSESSVLTAREEITVAAADVDGVKLVPIPAFTLSGHLRADAQSSLDLSQFSVNLRVAEPSDDGGGFKSDESFGENAQVDRQGNFSWKNVNPGNYILRLYGGDGHNDFFLKSARVGASTADSTFSLSGPAALDLVVGTKGASIEGIVTDRDQQGNDAPVSNVEVVAVPEEKYRNIPERSGEGATDQFGRFTIHGLAPGSYTLFAWQDVGYDVYRDPDFLKSQEANGTSVRVEEGVHETVGLKLSAVSDDWR
jgi:hypothetical protein